MSLINDIIIVFSRALALLGKLLKFCFKQIGWYLKESEKVFKLWGNKEPKKNLQKGEIL